MDKWGPQTSPVLAPNPEQGDSSLLGMWSPDSTLTPPSFPAGPSGGGEGTLGESTVDWGAGLTPGHVRKIAEPQAPV